MVELLVWHQNVSLSVRAQVVLYFFNVTLGTPCLAMDTVNAMATTNGLQILPNVKVGYICHGCGLQGDTSRTYFGLYGVEHRMGKGAGHNDDTVRDGYRILTYRTGGHALASPKGGGSCPLSTCSYLFATHLACQ